MAEVSTPSIDAPASVRRERIGPADIAGQPLGGTPPDALSAERSDRWPERIVWSTLALSFVAIAVYLIFF